MRPLLRPLLGVAFIAALAPAQLHAQGPTSLVAPKCNVGSTFEPQYAACLGAYTQFEVAWPQGDPQEVLDLMKVEANWRFFNDVKPTNWADLFHVVSSWTLGTEINGEWVGGDFRGKTDFDDDGVASSAGPFSGVGDAPDDWPGDGTAPQDYPDGYYSLNFRSPYTGIFAVLLKSATNFSVYLFAVGRSVESIVFQTDGVSDGRKLSHAALFGGDPVTVPEPSSLLLLGSGLLGLGFVGYRRRRK